MNGVRHRPHLQIDDGELNQRGFTLLPGLASDADLVEFERVIDALCDAQIEARGIARRHPDPFTDVMLADEAYRRYLFPKLRQLAVVQRIASEIGARLAESGFLDRHALRAPLIWPYFRADLPNESTYLLPFHQDILSTQSAKAWRIWLPMRRVDRHHGSMELVAGSRRSGWFRHTGGETPEAQVEEANIPKERRVCVEAVGGTGVLFHPGVLHRSVQNRSDHVKFVILIQVQDAAELYGPETIVEARQPSQSP